MGWKPKLWSGGQVLDLFGIYGQRDVEIRACSVWNRLATAILLRQTTLGYIKHYKWPLLNQREKRTAEKKRTKYTKNLNPPRHDVQAQVTLRSPHSPNSWWNLMAFWGMERPSSMSTQNCCTYDMKVWCFEKLSLSTECASTRHTSSSTSWPAVTSLTSPDMADRSLMASPADVAWEPLLKKAS